MRQIPNPTHVTTNVPTMLPTSGARRKAPQDGWMVLPKAYVYLGAALSFAVGTLFGFGYLQANVAGVGATNLHRLGGGKPTVLVTGGLGFIGGHVVEDLIDTGFHVVIYDDMSNGKNFHRRSSAVLIKDITVVEDYSFIVHKIDYVVHLAAAISVEESTRLPEKYERINIEGSRKVLDWALRNGVKRVVAASSGAVYGTPAPEDLPLREEIASGGISPYAKSKFEMEHIMAEFNNRFKLPCTALRFFNVYGPRQDPHSSYSGVMSWFMEQSRINGTLKISGDGEQYRDFVYVKDVARAIRTAMLLDSDEFDAFNVCTGSKTTINELAKQIVASFQSTATITHGPSRDADIRESVCSPVKASTKLGSIALLSMSNVVLRHHDHVTMPVELYTQTGALISMISCSLIIVSYLRRRKWRRHPNPLLYWKSVVDLVFAVRFQFNWDQFANELGCRSLATLTQFCSFSSECWFLSMSLDLYQCSTNPFTNIKQNLQWYHSFSWGMGLVFALVLWFSDMNFDPLKDPQCFVNENDTKFLLIYYFVVVLSVLCAVGFSVLENQSQPHCGMKEALNAKKDVIRTARIFTIAYIIYQVILISLWVADMVFLNFRPEKLQLVRNASSFLQTAKGFIDLVIWVAVNGLKQEQSNASADGSDQYSDVDVDLQPQLNVALRKEVLHFTTRGVVAASSNSSKATASRRVVRLRLHELGMVVRFDDYNPAMFRDIRRGFGIREALYRKSFLATCHERIQSGGSSGAFMFYTADYSYLVKSVTRSERAVLLRMLPACIRHMKANPGSHLTRFYGCHSIEMYGQTFSFVVMGNAIGRVSMHQFYDIKGSWIDRNAKPIPPGKTVICTYCSNAFKYGSVEHCEYSIHGTHLPHIVHKDNDFHRKLRILPQSAQEVVDQLERDSNFLCSQGIMDYSLLLSIHSTKYVVDHTSFDVNNLTSSPTKRKINYAVCHPACDDSLVSTQTGEVDLSDDDSFSDDDLDTVELGNRQQFNRSCRVSVLHHNEEKMQYDTPLLARSRAARYEAVQFGTFDIGSPNVDQSKWVGSRSIEKPGYQAYAVVGPDYYTIGVIDMLQTWTWSKRLERMWKVYVLRYDGNGISAAPPKAYAERFQRKMREIMMVSSARIGFGHQ
ncbi:TPA: hypothetical protein N0F65_007231 [Lagenidium giganteum]|uniref:PIPK domain-containing protein n=1 Tax=Lagenidium giganteum TaxID=4803 RepID=A0AAV2ZAH3_9STRA|nr:TPA: hypothetical protein N0F65_007231 [Lagenidium giganteum]